ncbi:MAG: sulfatase-like hydrolase/transferase [Muribaculaceae bacterium]|nr:sulfatase-like hydrolase/transferase [Muribaculaceae bacterium]
MKSEKRNPIFMIFTHFVGLYLLVGVLVRIVLMTMPPKGASLSVLEGVKSLLVGIPNDLAVAVVMSVPLLIIYFGLNEWKYKMPVGYTLVALLACGVFYTTFTHSIFHEYGGGAPRIARYFFLWKLVSFSLRFFIPSLRKNWRRVAIFALWGVYVFLTLFNGVAEYFFWDEFGVRYNFIAVDYLVYTHEVVGNIMESYSIVPIVVVTALLSGLLIWLVCRKNKFVVEGIYTLRSLAVHVGAYVAMFAVSLLYMIYVSPATEGENLYANQVGQNGVWDFFKAFQSSSLEYDKFYQMLPAEECKKDYRVLCGLDNDGMKTYADSIPMRRHNIVLVTVESLSSSFLTDYGCDKNLTPNIDTLMTKSLVFDNMYAVGNRTVRGLEALSLCIPPSAGESIVKRSDNAMGDLSVGALFRREGYKTRFLYGGDSYFDNMGDYFGKNGYEVGDRKQLTDDQVTFANIWGVCDEDLYSMALRTFDDDARHNVPFFAQIMTVSNHRPFTYPDGKITIDGDPQSRDGAVKYTDYAIGRFLREASGKPWFDNTIFIITADHQASSAGKTSIPVNRYHIPCIVYAPRIIEPQRVEALCSQIDVIPTLLTLLHYSGKVPFAGGNVLAPDFRPRAWMATYQDLGYLEDSVLTVLSPVNKCVQFDVKKEGADFVTGERLARENSEQKRRAQTYYQYVNLYLPR